MRRLAGYILIWLAATVAAVFVAWQFVAVVGTQVTDPRPAPLTPEQARQARAAPSEATETPPPPSAPATSPTTSPPSPGATPPKTAPPSTAQPPTTTTQPSSPELTETRTYNLVGGSVALRFRPSGVSVLWANPNPGFEVKIDEAHDNGVRVEFRSDSRRSEVEAWWEDGPRDQVREDTDGGSPGKS